MSRSLPFLFSLLLVSSCAAGRSTYYLWTAEREFIAANEVQAPEKAVYEYTLAHQYLLKAREEHGYSDYKAAEGMARKSAEWSGKAAAVAEYGTSERDLMLEEMGQEVPDAADTVEEDHLVPLDIGSED